LTHDHFAGFALTTLSSPPVVDDFNEGIAPHRHLDLSLSVLPCGFTTSRPSMIRYIARLQRVDAHHPVPVIRRRDDDRVDVFVVQEPGDRRRPGSRGSVR
jgi:hypothetical protein